MAIEKYIIYDEESIIMTLLNIWKDKIDESKLNYIKRMKIKGVQEKRWHETRGESKVIKKNKGRINGRKHKKNEANV